MDGDAISIGSMETVAAGYEVRWVAVDSLGGVYFTDEPHSRVMMRNARDLALNLNATVLHANVSGHVSAPSGVATDNYFVYWVNKLDGTQVGSLVQGAIFNTTKSRTLPAAPLTTNAAKS